VKTVIAIDCTKSMGRILQNVKKKIKVVVNRTEEILKLAQKNASSQQQFIIYRNYNSDPS
jgi:acetone carboxylase gamma subunit